jgi:hypothetical protein
MPRPRQQPAHGVCGSLQAIANFSITLALMRMSGNVSAGASTIASSI